MNIVLIAALVVCLAPFAGTPQQKKPTETQVAIDKLRVEMQAPLAELSALTESDKQIARSNQTQVDTSGMLERSKRRIETESQPALKAKMDALNEKRRIYIASGCPAEGGQAPPALAERCNRERIPLIQEYDRLVKEDAALKEQLAAIEATRQAVTATTLANVRTQKANAERREQLEALRAAHASQLRKLYLTGISDVVKRADLKAKASAACNGIPSLEDSVCCGQVVSDDRPAAQCNVPLIVSAFEKAGIFGTTVVK